MNDCHRKRATIDTQRPSAESMAAARDAGLTYTTDTEPGICRVATTRGFRYLAPNGKPIRSKNVLRRIKSLVIPPAWTDVWICRSPNGHLQVTGRDARGRKQCRYHPRWREVRDDNKYYRLIGFGEILPRIRARVRRDLRRGDLSHDMIVATVVRLLERSLIRVGNEEYARQNGSFGLTTMRTRHARVVGSEICFEFKGKSGVRHRVTVHDRRLARIIRRCQDIPGQELFQYLDEKGRRHRIGSADVNAYLHTIAGVAYTAKDFRTWAGTILAAEALRGVDPPRSMAHAKRTLAQAVEKVSLRLGNTRSVCRKCYIHPAILDAYLDGTLGQALTTPSQRAGTVKRLRAYEEAVHRLLRKSVRARLGGKR